MIIQPMHDAVRLFTAASACQRCVQVCCWPRRVLGRRRECSSCRRLASGETACSFAGWQPLWLARFSFLTAVETHGELKQTVMPGRAKHSIALRLYIAAQHRRHWPLLHDGMFCTTLAQPLPQVKKKLAVRGPSVRARQNLGLAAASLSS